MDADRTRRRNLYLLIVMLLISNGCLLYKLMQPPAERPLETDSKTLHQDERPREIGASSFLDFNPQLRQNIFITGSSNGRTLVFGTKYLGSSPSPVANRKVLK